ncbi:hypothetical protein HP678_001875, partial [Campylobacter jejuni]|nr:hypothetical protein [Campylobacter jejuni]
MNGGGNTKDVTKTFGVAAMGGEDITEKGLKIGTDTTENEPIFADKNFQPEPQVGEENWQETFVFYGGRALKKETKMKPCYGSFARPTNEKGGQAKFIIGDNGQPTENHDITMAFFDTPGGTITGGTGGPQDELKADIVMYTENINLETPDTHVVYKPGKEDDSSEINLVQQSMPNRPNYIGFRDNFVGLMYYNSTGNMGVLAGQASQLNAVVDLQDRNTELSYQLLLDSLGDR